MAKQILRIEAIHSSQAFVAKWKHNYRIGNVPNADKSLRNQNQQLIKIPAGETYNSFFERKIAEQPYYDTHKIRKNGIRGYELMLSYGSKDLPEDFSIEHWAEQSKKFIQETFGKENVASAVLHMDEGTPHIHAVVIPMKDGKLSARAFIKDRQDMRDLHTRYHEYTKDCGLEAENRYMLIDHTKTAMFYNNINEALEKNLPGPKENESLEEYAERANEFYKIQMLRDFGREHQIAQLQKKNDALEKANKTLEKQAENKYQQQLNQILSEIGSVKNAVHAIQYRDSLQNAIKWTQENNPELADSISTIITNMQTNYARAMDLDHTHDDNTGI